MSLVTTPKFKPGQSRLHKRSTRAVFPQPTGPAIPTRNALILWPSSEQKISLSQGQVLGWFAGQQLPVRSHLVGLRINLDVGCRRIVNHVAFADGPASLHSHGALTEDIPDSGCEGSLRNEGGRRGSCGPAERSEHRPVEHRLRRWNGGVGVAHDGPGDEAALGYQF